MGLVDLHVHAGPSVMPRELDVVEMLKEAIENNYSAFVVKDHYFPTFMTATTIQKHLSNDKCKIFGGLALNNSVGGLNLKAVDAACAMGAKFIWMPTVSAKRHKEMHSGKGLKFPSNKGMTVEEDTICYLDDDGNLKKEVVEILNYLKDKEDVVLGTGHGSRDEINSLIEKANETGIKKILVNHPHYMIGASLEDTIRWSKLGAYIELNAAVFVPTSRFGVNKIRDAVDIVKNVDLNKIVVDSDYGQINNGSPVRGLKEFINILKDACGLSEEEVKKITEENPAYLLGL